MLRSCPIISRLKILSQTYHADTFKTRQVQAWLGPNSSRCRRHSNANSLRGVPCQLAEHPSLGKSGTPDSLVLAVRIPNAIEAADKLLVTLKPMSSPRLD